MNRLRKTATAVLAVQGLRVTTRGGHVAVERAGGVQFDEAIPALCVGSSTPTQSDQRYPVEDSWTEAIVEASPIVRAVRRRVTAPIRDECDIAELRSCDSIEVKPAWLKSEIEGGASGVVSLEHPIAALEGADEELRTLSELRQELIRIVEKKGLLRLAEPVQLASGSWSSEFIDGKRALSNGQDLELACRALVELVDEAGIEFDAVGGLTLGADQFSHGVAMVRGCDWFVVRKETKGRGTNRRIEGAELDTGTRVLLVDDVVTAGGSIKQAYEVVRATGATVVGAVTLVDRGGNANAFFEAEHVFFSSLVTYVDLGIPPVVDGPLNT